MYQARALRVKAEEGDEKYGTVHHTTPHHTTPHHRTKVRKAPDTKEQNKQDMYSPNPSLLVFRFSYPSPVISGDLARWYRFLLADFARAVPVRPLVRILTGKKKKYLKWARKGGEEKRPTKQ